MFLSTDLTALPNVVRQRMHQLLTEENGMAALQAKIRQQQIAKFYHDNPPRARDGVGGMQMSMDPYWLNYWRWKLGTERVGQDPEVRKWILKKHECFRVKHRGTKDQFASAEMPKRGERREERGGITAVREGRRTFRKTY